MKSLNLNVVTIIFHFIFYAKGLNKVPMIRIKSFLFELLTVKVKPYEKSMVL